MKENNKNKSTIKIEAVELFNWARKNDPKLKGQPDSEILKYFLGLKDDLSSQHKKPKKKQQKQ
jgi:hypothetical protein